MVNSLHQRFSKQLFGGSFAIEDVEILIRGLYSESTTEITLVSAAVIRRFLRSTGLNKKQGP